MIPLEQLFAQALVHHQAGQLVEAEQGYRQVLAMEPRHADALHLLGLIAHQAGNPGVAVELIGQAIAIEPAFPAFRSSLGAALLGLNRHEEAAAAFQAALDLGSASPADHYHLGNALRNLGRLDAALAAYDGAVARKPELAEAWFNRGVTLADLGRSQEAVEAYDAGLRFMPDLAEAHTNRGNALQDLGRLEEALAAQDLAIGLRPGLAVAHYNRGNALRRLNRLDEALAAYGEALAIDPNYAEAHSNRGGVLCDLSRPADAVAAFEAATRLRPNYGDAHYNQALAHGLLGDLEAGWPKLEWRFRRGPHGYAPRPFAQPQWRGEDIAGRTILLHAEQGLGDAIQFCRYAPLVAARGARVILEAPRPILKLLSSLAGVKEMVAAGDPLPAFDLHCPLMSLPGAFGTTAGTVPADIPYLYAEDSAVAAWRGRIGSEGFRIGLAWQGNPSAAAERGRSAPLGAFVPLAAAPGVRLISLQKIHGLDQLGSLPPWVKVETLGEDFDAGPDAFIDTAAAMMNLDLIVTVDTAIAHLAGALGRPVWLALQKAPHWIWMTEREDSPWYPSALLFRQCERGDWDGVFGRMAQALNSKPTVVPG